MTPGAIRLDALDLTVAGGLVLMAGLVSLALRLGLEKRLALASVRTVVQLLLVGYVLKYVFGLATLTFGGATLHAFLTLAIVGLVTTTAVTTLVIAVEPWYQPRYFIPLLGMVLGNGLTGISLAMDTLLDSLAERRAEVEMELAHGASRWEAALPPLRDAVRRGMIPIINSMMVVGVVSLPGMMTGQILAGASPLEAVKYQVVIMFMLAGATSLGCIGMALLIYRRLFNDRHQLRADLIRRRAA
jgi:putative ABC transport system permease protein